MLKILVWDVTKDKGYLDDALKILERQHNGIELVGVTAGAETSLVYDGKNIPFVPLDEAGRMGGGYDVLLVADAGKVGMNKVTSSALKLKLPEEKLLADWIVCIPGFTLDKYRRLQRSRLSILAMNCFGGVISNKLGLQFLSPFVNMFFKEPDYLRFLYAPQSYMAEQLTFKETLFDVTLKKDYPVVMLGDVVLHMNHYRDFDEAVKIWEQRKTRINWYNLFVTIYTEDEKVLQEFDALPYGKKVCFVPFKSDLDSAWYIDRNITKRKYFWQTINDSAKGIPFYYDPFDMLLYGKKTQLIDM